MALWSEAIDLTFAEGHGPTLQWMGLVMAGSIGRLGNLPESPLYQALQQKLPACRWDALQPEPEPEQLKGYLERLLPFNFH